jgi:hypothetical protein
MCKPSGGKTGVSANSKNLPLKPLAYRTITRGRAEYFRLCDARRVYLRDPVGLVVEIHDETWQPSPLLELFQPILGCMIDSPLFGHPHHLPNRKLS